MSMTIGARIRERRVAAGLSQAECARRSGIVSPSLNRLELHSKAPQRKTIDRIAAAIGCTPEELLGVSPPPSCARVHADLSPAAMEHVIRLLATGLYGATVDDVVTGLALAELRRVVRASRPQPTAPTRAC